MTQCGAATIIPRCSSIFPRVQGLESCRKWLRSFFSMKNATRDDLINLPAYVASPPTVQHNWGYNPKDRIAEVNSIYQVVEQLKDEGLTGDDLVATFISHRVHKICHMSGPMDPTRTSTHELTKAQIWRRVKANTKTQLTAEWEWGMEPYSRTKLPPVVSDLRHFNRYNSSSDIHSYVCRLKYPSYLTKFHCICLAEVSPAEK